jgi:hypothetical protein
MFSELKNIIWRRQFKQVSLDVKVTIIIIIIIIIIIMSLVTAPFFPVCFLNQR